MVRMVLGERFKLVERDSDLVATSVLDWIWAIPASSTVQIYETPVEATEITSAEFAASRQVNLASATACLVIECRRGDRIWHAVIVGPGDRRVDLNGKVRKLLGARTVKMAAMEWVTDMLGQEKGSIGPLGIPDNVPLLVEESLMRKEVIFAGSGLLRSKIAFDPAVLQVHPGLIVADIVQ